MHYDVSDRFNFRCVPQSGLEQTFAKISQWNDDKDDNDDYNDEDDDNNDEDDDANDGQIEGYLFLNIAGKVSQQGYDSLCPSGSSPVHNTQDNLCSRFLIMI